MMTPGSIPPSPAPAPPAAKTSIYAVLQMHESIISRLICSCGCYDGLYVCVKVKRSRRTNSAKELYQLAPSQHGGTDDEMK